MTNKPKLSSAEINGLIKDFKKSGGKNVGEKLRDTINHVTEKIHDKIDD